ncbi:HTRA2-related serine protease [Carabus blaptoides fortunei]
MSVTAIILTWIFHTKNLDTEDAKLESENNDEATAEDVDSSKEENEDASGVAENILASFKNTKKVTIEKLAAELTEDQLEAEKQAERAQLAAILELLKQQEDKFQVGSMDELEGQLKFGSGFIISEDGWILSNAHVVMNKPNALVCVVTAKGAAYTATVHDIDLKHDLALLKIPSTGLPSLSLGDSSSVSTGEWVVALGNPLSLKHTITAGVISSVDRDARELGITSHSMKYIQTDASITFGHSGGPLVNLAGEVIGINNLKITAGIAFAIPVDYAKDFLSRSSMYSSNKSSEVIARPLLGITGLEMSAWQWDGSVDQDNSIAVQGVFVYNIASDSAADKAGLKTGDIITHINEIPVTKTSSIFASMSNGRKSVFTVYRPGTKESFYIEIPT